MPLPPQQEPDFSQIPELVPPPAPPGSPAFSPQVTAPPPQPQPGVLPVPGVPPTPQGPISLSGMERQDAAAAANNLDARTALTGAQLNQADEHARLAKWESEQMAPIKEHAELRATQYAGAMSALQKELMTKGQEYMRNTQDAINAASSAVVNPEDVWHGSTGRKVAAAIALALGTYASIRSKTPNAAAQIINATIQRNIDAQKHKAMLLQAKATGQGNLYQQFRQKIGDAQGAESALYGAYAEQVSKMVDKYANTFKTPEAQQAAQNLKLQLAQDYADKSGKAFDDYHRNLIQDKTLELKSYALDLKRQAASAAPEQTQLSGLEGARGDKGIEKATSEKWGGTLAAVDILNDSVEQMKAGKLSVGQFAEAVSENTVLRSELRAALDMSKRMSGGEGKDLMSLTPGLGARAMAAVLGDTTGAITKVEAARDALLRAGLQRAHGSNSALRPVLDPANPQYNPLVADWVAREAAKKGAAAARQQLRAPQ